MAETLETIYKLHTTHGNFLKKPIEDEKIDAIIDAAVRAANASARQSYSIITLRSSEQVQATLGGSGAAALIFCVDFNRLIDLSRAVGSPWLPESTQAFLTGSTDTILAAQTACISAADMGFGTLFTNSLHRKDIDEVFDILGLPEKYCFPLISLVLGYPSRKTHKTKGRLTGSGIVHDACYQRMSEEETVEVIEAYDKRGNRLGQHDLGGCRAHGRGRSAHSGRARRPDHALVVLGRRRARRRGQSRPTVTLPAPSHRPAPNGRGKNFRALSDAQTCIHTDSGWSRAAKSG